MILITISFARSADEESCCFCIAETTDKSTTSECQRWLRENSSRLECTKKVIFPSHQQVSFEKDLSCRKVTAFGANHGLSYYYTTVFQFASKASTALRPVEIHYDGSTCLVFNNVSAIESETQRLSIRFPNVRFVLAGNQNQGVVRHINLFGIGERPKEIQGMSSKMTVVAQSGFVDVTYGDCSKSRAVCSFNRGDMGATNDSNTKFCQDESQTTVAQKCCEPIIGNWGRWSAPGMNCKVR